MNIGTPMSKYEHDGDANALATWMIELADQSPDRLAIIELPIAGTEQEADDLQDTVVEAFEIAKRDRPDLGARILHRKHPGPDPQRLVLQIHEHQWVAGECVRGCGQTRVI